MLTHQNVKAEIKYHISLPTKDAHHKTHQTRGPHLMAQRENPQITQQIMEIIIIIIIIINFTACFALER